MNVCKIKSGQFHILVGTAVLVTLLNSCQVKKQPVVNEHWVSPNGISNAAGTRDNPFSSIHEVIDSLRKILPHQNSDITIWLKDGTYRLDTTLVLDSTLSGHNGHKLIFRAESGASPVISGAVQITNWEATGNRNIYKASARGKKSRQLYVNGKRAVRARTTDNPSGFKPVYSNVHSGIHFIPTSLNKSAWAHPAKWTNQNKIEAIIQTQWKMMSVPVDTIFAPGIIPELQNGVIAMQEPGWSKANLYTYLMDETPVWSFWQVTRFENAFEFLDEPGEWYLDETKDTIYYIPLPEDNMATAIVELPWMETLLAGHGTETTPLRNLGFDGITFSYATWMEPGSPAGYVSDQSGMLVGDNNIPNSIGHVERVRKTGANIAFSHITNLQITNCTFNHLGGAALDLDIGTQNSVIENNLFSGISAAAIQLGGVDSINQRPANSSDWVTHNTIRNNTISNTGQEFVDAAGIFVGFTSYTDISFNTISNVPWSGIAMGWGWGLLDTSGFPGLEGAGWFEWGKFSEPTQSRYNRITHNRFENFLQNRWDGGAIYTTGQQGTSMEDALLIEANVALYKNNTSGGNIFYTDGGSRYITLRRNVSIDNPIGYMNFGPEPSLQDSLPTSRLLPLLNTINYGGDCGGCRTFGDILYENNYWLATPLPTQEETINKEWDELLKVLKIFQPSLDDTVKLYSAEGFFNICPFNDSAVSQKEYPVNMDFSSNYRITDPSAIPQSLLDSAGVQI